MEFIDYMDLKSSGAPPKLSEDFKYFLSLVKKIDEEREEVIKVTKDADRRADAELEAMKEKAVTRPRRQWKNSADPAVLEHIYKINNALEALSGDGSRISCTVEGPCIMDVRRVEDNAIVPGKFIGTEELTLREVALGPGGDLIFHLTPDYVTSFIDARLSFSKFASVFGRDAINALRVTVPAFQDYLHWRDLSALATKSEKQNRVGRENYGDKFGSW